VPRLSVVVVTWNRRDLLADCLASLAATQEERPQTIVVDNGSSDRTAALVAERFPWAELMRLEENTGFARANNLAIERASGEVVLLLNDDTVVLESFAPVLALFADAAVGAAGPRLVGADGASQLTARQSFPTPRRVLGDYFPGDRDERDPPGGPVAWLAGAALFVRTEAYRAAGGLDEGYFMFFEEADLCRRLHERGLRVLYERGVSVRHLGGAAVGVPLFVERAYYESLFRFLRASGARGVVPLRATLALGAGLRALVALVRGDRPGARRLGVAVAACLGVGRDARTLAR
jgi:GT2 family glycosyltransferase